MNVNKPVHVFVCLHDEEKQWNMLHNSWQTQHKQERLYVCVWQQWMYVWYVGVIDIF